MITYIYQPLNTVWYGRIFREREKKKERKGERERTYLVQLPNFFFQSFFSKELLFHFSSSEMLVSMMGKMLQRDLYWRLISFLENIDDYNINKSEMLSNILLFGGFSSHLRLFNSYRDATNTRWKNKHSDLYSALMDISIEGSLSCEHLLWHGTFIYICCWLFSGAITTRFNDLVCIIRVKY